MNPAQFIINSYDGPSTTGSRKREPTEANLRAKAILEANRARNASLPDTQVVTRQQRRWAARRGVIL
jgi:hypothetical protein